MIALFFDTETTGVKTWRNPNFVPRLVQLGAILQDMETGRVLAEVNLMIHPEGGSIPQEAAAVHGISADLATQFGLKMVSIDALFCNLIARADLLVCHNTAYDLEVVADNLPVSHRSLQGKRKICTMEASRDVVKAPLTQKQIDYFKTQDRQPDHEYKNPNLTETYQHFFGEPFVGAHDAMADIRACRDIFIELRKLEAVS